MNPPRWDSPYADGVRDALTRMIDAGEPDPAASSPRRSGTARLVVALVIALLLVVPASITAVVLAGRAGPAGGGTPVVAPAAPTPTSTTARPASAGCAPTTGRIPAGADTGVIDDVDGDHRPDTEWAVLLGGTVRFGITTASGATVSAGAQFAGGGDRTFVVGHLANGAVVVIPSDSRTSDLLTFRDCALHVAEGANPALPSVGTAFTLYSSSGGGDAMCLDGELDAVSYRDAGGQYEDVLVQRVAVSADGSTAKLSGTKRILASHLDPTALRRYQGISCGTAPVLRPKQAP